MSDRFSLRASDFANPEMAARRLTQVLNQLREELAPPRRALVDVTFQTDSGGNVTPLALQPPSWPVRAVKAVYQWDLTTNVATYFRVAYKYDSQQLVVSVFAGDVSPSRSYALRLELSGE